MRLISHPLHGILDYIAGFFLLVSPRLFGYAQLQPVSGDIAMIIGSGIMLYTALTNFEVGIVRLIPFPAHLILDVLTGLVLLGAPILSAVTGTAGAVFLVVGAFELVAVFLTSGEGRSSGRPSFPTWS